ncbi:hypothetical protein [Arvimicrobium flavum]|uniref:hypothetical protein n=1 Tax=Arvimicrobium flavum TaxID=3393320 RepID=UPI00237A75A2|nr:hypothetical protein [Mesorhizobium shangrilense]
MDTISFAAAGISVSVDLRIGHIADLTIRTDGRELKPLHRAPWIDEPEAALPDSLPQGTRWLSGDFLCAPFSASDVEPAPLHGWPANSRWHPVESAAIPGGWRARLRLEKTVMGATVEKILTLRDGHPFLYQEHAFIGGAGELPAAHHPMTVMKTGGRIAYSPKRLALTPGASLEPDPARGRYVLAYPAKTTDLTAFPRTDGGVYDLTRYPADGAAEDFIVLVEADHAGPGWTAVARAAESDLFLVLKNPAELPVTMLWISNGGRDYAPWNGRHRGVLGIEDGRTAVGHAASLGDNTLKALGVPTSFSLRSGGAVTFRHVLGGLPLQSGSDAPRDVATEPDLLRASFPDGRTASVPFDGAFLDGVG